MKIQYQHTNFKPESLATIDEANGILLDYEADGYVLTLRQLYYQFVARNLIKENTMRAYKNFGTLMRNARLAGLVDWEHMEDRLRELDEETHWDSAQEILRGCAQNFLYDLWEDQEYRVEVWVEKDALSNIIQPVCADLDVPFFACRGYVSASSCWQAGRRALERWEKWMQTTVILHLGDHDPSGINMTEDIDNRLAMFGEGNVHVQRIALTMEQIEEYEPPPQPAKKTDSRHRKYKANHGSLSWELDALEPEMLDRLIRHWVGKWRDEALWLAKVEDTQHVRAQLRTLANDWEELK